MNKYEALLIFKSSFENDGLEALLNKAEAEVKQHGGKLLRSDKIGRKKLAYPIQKSPEGLIAVLAFEAPATAIKPITNSFNLNEELVRYNIARNDAMDINKPFIVTPVTGREPREIRGGRRGGPARPQGPRRPRSEGAAEAEAL